MANINSKIINLAIFWPRWYRAGKEDQGAAALVLDLAKAFERVSLPVVRDRKKQKQE